MLPPDAEHHISSRESSDYSRATRKRFFNHKEFSSNVGYLSRSFRNSIIDDEIIKDFTYYLRLALNRINKGITLNRINKGIIASYLIPHPI